ncbi:SH3 domain-containing protein [Paraclostridium bifermentans]|uniref:SH3 domain-containing protein n=1 Tax=Paraclostridium bifermentans TaxID=1490 RepID=UPI00374F9F7B
MNFKRKLSSLVLTAFLTLGMSLPISAQELKSTNQTKTENVKVDYSMFGTPENQSGLPENEIVQPRHLPTSLKSEVNPRSNLTIDGIGVSRQLIPINYYDEYQTPKYIVIHDTGNRAKGANAQAHRNYFATNENANSSAHYFIDDSHIVQTVDDHNGSWHCGDGRSPVIHNRNTIGIEMCVNSDGNFKETVRHTEELTKYLMSKYNIPAERVVRHNDVSGKICPAMMIQDKVVTWSEFKSKIGGYDNSLKSMNKLGKVVNTDTLSVREDGGRNSGIVSTLKGGQEVTISGQRLNDWYQIKLGNSRYGYVSNEYIQIIKDLTPTEPTVNETPMNRMAKVVNLDAGDSLNFRSKPNASASLVGTINSGTQVKVTAKCDNGWYKINFNNKDGYASGYYLELLPEVKVPTTTATVNIREKAEWSSKQIGQIPANTQVEVLGYISDFYKVKYNNITGYVSQTYVANVDKSKIPEIKPEPVIKPVTVNAYINLRTLPQWTCDKLGVIPEGSTVEPVGYTGEWIKVKYNNEQGFINEMYLNNLDKSKLSEIPVVKDNATISASVNLRETASWSGKQLGVISQGTRVHFVQTEGEWSKVIVNGQTGYIYSDYVNVDGADKLLTVTANINLRETADWGGKQLGVIPQGTQVKLIEKGNEWTKVQWNNLEGFVYNDYVK